MRNAWFGVCTLACERLKSNMLGWQSGHSGPTGGLFYPHVEIASYCHSNVRVSYRSQISLEPLRDLFYLMPKNGRLDWKAAVFAMDGCVQLSSSCCSGQSIPRTTEAAKLFVFGEKLTFGGANPQNGAFMMRRKFLDFGWFQPIVMFWVEWDSLISTGVAWRTHNSCVHLENLYQKKW